MTPNEKKRIKEAIEKKFQAILGEKKIKPWVTTRDNPQYDRLLDHLKAVVEEHYKLTCFSAERPCTKKDCRQTSGDYKKCEKFQQEKEYSFARTSLVKLMNENTKESELTFSDAFLNTVYLYTGIVPLPKVTQPLLPTVSKSWTIPLGILCLLLTLIICVLLYNPEDDNSGKTYSAIDNPNKAFEELSMDEQDKNVTLLHSYFDNLNKAFEEPNMKARDKHFEEAHKLLHHENRSKKPLDSFIKGYTVNGYSNIHNNIRIEKIESTDNQYLVRFHVSEQLMNNPVFEMVSENQISVEKLLSTSDISGEIIEKLETLYLIKSDNVKEDIRKKIMTSRFKEVSSINYLTSLSYHFRDSIKLKGMVTAPNDVIINRIWEVEIRNGLIYKTERRAIW